VRPDRVVLILTLYPALNPLRNRNLNLAPSPRSFRRLSGVLAGQKRRIKIKIKSKIRNRIKSKSKSKIRKYPGE